MRKIKDRLRANAWPIAIVVLLSGVGIVKAVENAGDGFQFLGHVTSVALTPPPLGTNCTIVAGSTDFFGSCAATATAAVAVAWGKVYNAAPRCVVLDQTTFSGNALAAGPTTTGFTMGTTVVADKISWICVGGVSN